MRAVARYRHMPSRYRRRLRTRGLALTELVVATVALVAAFGVATTPLRERVSDRGLEAARSAIADQLLIASSTARARGESAWLCPLAATRTTEAGATEVATGARPRCGTDWSVGSLVLVDDGRIVGEIDEADTPIATRAAGGNARMRVWVRGPDRGAPRPRARLRLGANGRLDAYAAMAVACDGRGEKAALWLAIDAAAAARTLVRGHGIWAGSPRCPPVSDRPRPAVREDRQPGFSIAPVVAGAAIDGHGKRA